MISNAADEIATIVNKIAIEVRETEEEFVWTQVEPWLSRTMERHISKRELVEALEKQRPKKPVATEYFSGGCCPCCGEYIVIEYSFPKHCENCGQALDWSEEE